MYYDWKARLRLIANLKLSAENSEIEKRNLFTSF